MLVIEGLDKATADLPFAMLGVNSAKDSAFIDQSVFDCVSADEICRKLHKYPAIKITILILIAIFLR